MTSAFLLPEGKQSFQTATGAPLAGGRLYTYAAGTSTPKPTWADADKVSANPNPIILDARGEATIFWDGAYKVELRDAADVLIWTVDKVEAGDATLRAELAGPSGSTLVGYRHNPAAVTRTVESRLRETAFVSDFGAVGDGIVNDTAALQAALNWVRDNNGRLVFGARKQYRVSQVTLANLVGGNERSNCEIEGNGSTLVGITSTPALRIYRSQGVRLSGLRISRGPGATYGAELDSMWFAHIADCSFDNVEIKSDNLWGFYWNTLTGCDTGNIRFNLTTYTINHNLFTNCRVGNITKTAALGTPKEAYNNVFQACDITGTLIDWRDASEEFRQFPLVFRDSNIEANCETYGFIELDGGLSIFGTAPTGAQTHYPFDDLRSAADMWGSGNFRSTHWLPHFAQNHISGGAAATPVQGIAAVGFSPLVTAADATAPVPSARCFPVSLPSTNNAIIRVTLPASMLAMAKSVGFVSFSWWIRHGGAATGGRTVSYDTGAGSAFMHVPYPVSGGQWVQRFLTVPVPSGATQVVLDLGGETAATADFRVTGIAAYLGRFARPWMPSVPDVQAYRHNAPTFPANPTDLPTCLTAVAAILDRLRAIGVGL